MLTSTSDFISRESQKRRRRYTLLKKRNLTNQSPGSGKNGTSGGNIRSVVRPAQDSGSEADKGGKAKRRRRKSSKKNLSNTVVSPSDDDTGNGMALLYLIACTLTGVLVASYVNRRLSRNFIFSH